MNGCLPQARDRGAVLRADGERSPSWLALLRFTSVEHLPVCPQPAFTILPIRLGCGPVWVCLFAKHQGSVASSEQTITPRRPAFLFGRQLAGGGPQRGDPPLLLAAAYWLVQNQGTDVLAGR